MYFYLIHLVLVLILRHLTRHKQTLPNFIQIFTPIIHLQYNLTNSTHIYNSNNSYNTVATYNILHNLHIYSTTRHLIYHNITYMILILVSPDGWCISSIKTTNTDLLKYQRMQTCSQRINHQGKADNNRHYKACNRQLGS